ncbi:MAG: rhodanese-like domain-containing protein [Xanthomonadaceae bacterium]|nr:rhodanese-like domain-containing protein [Xanthomonadaceae bacterium]
MDFQPEHAAYAAIIGFMTHRFFKMKRVREQIPELIKSGAVIVDVRSAAEFSNGHAAKSINIPLDRISQEKSKLDLDKPVIVCCASGTRSGMAVGLLMAQGFKTVLNAGSWNSIKA